MNSGKDCKWQTAGLACVRPRWRIVAPIQTVAFRNTNGIVMPKPLKYPANIHVRVRDEDKVAIDEVRGHESISAFVMGAILKEVELRRRIKAGWTAQSLAMCRTGHYVGGKWVRT